MVIDNTIVTALVSELSSSLKDTRIDRINIISFDSFLFNIRTKESFCSLVLSLNSNFFRIGFSTNKYKFSKQLNPFLVQLKKYLEGAFIRSIEQINFDRIIRFSLEGTDSLRDKVYFFMYIELTGKNSNIILTTTENKIITAWRLIDHNRNEERQILPDALYVPITNKHGKLLMELWSEESINNAIRKSEDKYLKKLLVNKLYGISSHTAKCLISECGFSENICTLELKDIDTINLLSKLIDFRNNIFSGNISIKFVDSELSDFEIIYSQVPGKNLSQIIEDFQYKKELINKSKKLSNKIEKWLSEYITKLKAKLKLQKELLEQANTSESFKQKGELLLAFLHEIPEKSSSIELLNYYNYNNPEKISLNPDISVSENARKYFQKYNKLKNTALSCKKIIKEIQEELDYIEAIDVAFQNAQEYQDFLEIEDELISQGYISKKNIGKKDILKESERFIYEKTSDGFDILIGRNNRQNDYLTTKFASDNDLWLHARLIPGSHVILKTDNGQKKVSDTALLEAAIFAARFSKAKNSSNVCVIYTKTKYVKEPPHSKPGLVIYSNEKAIYVNP